MTAIIDFKMRYGVRVMNLAYRNHDRATARTPQGTALGTLLLGAALAGLLAPASAAAEEKAAKPTSFEQALEQARPVKDLAGLFDPIFDECKEQDELLARQCRIVRDWQLTVLRNEKVVSVGDWSALAWSPYSPSEKQVSLEVQGCLSCDKAVLLYGKPRYLTSRVPKAIKNGRATGIELGFHGVPVAAAEAAEWEKIVARRLRVQYVYKVGQPWKVGAAEGATFHSIAYRVFDPCTGEVVAADPPSSTQAPVMTDRATCPASTDKPAEDETVTDTLSRTQVERAISVVKKRVADCYTEWGYTTPVTVKLVVAGTGTVLGTQILPPHDKSDVGLCVRSAMRGIVMPKFNGDRLNITYPFGRPAK